VFCVLDEFREQIFEDEEGSKLARHPPKYRYIFVEAKESILIR
jgi:hypothetical protein